MNIAHMALLSN